MGKWKGDQFRDYQRNKMLEYLRSHDLVSYVKMEKIVEILQAESQKRRVPPYVAPSVILAVFAPVWVRFVDHQYSQIVRPDVAWAMLLGLPAGVILLLYTFGQIRRHLYQEVKELFFPDEVQYIQHMIDLLNECMLVLPSGGGSGKDSLTEWDREVAASLNQAGCQHYQSRQAKRRRCICKHVRAGVR